MPVYQSLTTKPVIQYSLSAKKLLTLFTKQVVVKVTALVYDNILETTKLFFEISTGGFCRLNVLIYYILAETAF